jgi:hypothetical protein
MSDTAERGRQRRRREERTNKQRDFLKLHFIVDCTSLLILCFQGYSSIHKHDSRQVKYPPLLHQGKFRQVMHRQSLPLQKDLQPYSKIWWRALHLHQKEEYISSIKVRSKRDRKLGKGDAFFLYKSEARNCIFEELPQKELWQEIAVSTVKRSISHALYSKKRRGQKKEIRLKVLTYNLAIIARLPAQLD